MISYIIFLLLGYVTLTVPAPHKERILSFFIEHRIRYKNLKESEDGGITFTVSYPVSREVLPYFEKMGIALSHSPVYGVPRLYKKYGKRYGALIGIAVFCFIVSLSGQRVWYMEVTGNDTVEDISILENLEALGFTYGTDFKKIDLDYLRNSYLATYDDLSWISINMTGTHAAIEVRELSDPKKEDTEKPVNVVAGENGKIVLVETYEGRPMVFPGDFVEKGQLVLSGLITDGEDTLRMEHASGVVLAEVQRTFTVEVSKKNEKKVYTGEEKAERTLEFFKKNIKLSRKCRISDSSYDTIKKKSQLCLFHTAPLPIFLESTVYKEYTFEYEPMSEKEVREKARALYSAKLTEVLNGAELIEESITEYDSDDKYVMACRIVCLADIAEKTEINFTDKAGEEQLNG